MFKTSYVINRLHLTGSRLDHVYYGGRKTIAKRIIKSLLHSVTTLTK